MPDFHVATDGDNGAAIGTIEDDNCYPVAS